MRIPGNEGRSTSSTQSSSILRHRFPHTVYFMARKQGDAIGKDAASMLVILELSLVDCCCPSSDEEEEVLLMLATASGTAAAADQHHATSAAAASSSSAAAMSSENLRRRWRELVEAAGCRDLASPPSNVDKDDGSAVAGARASTKTTMEFIPPSDALLERSIFKYIKWQDQYMAMISVLLKSRAYYQYTYSHKSQQPINRQDQEETVTTTTTTTISIKPVVNLPRTEYQKPYIPPLFEAPDGDDEKSYWDRPISVSHQFPYVGIARLVRRRQEKKERFEYRPFNKDGNFHKASSLLLGFDIVMFEYNQRMYRDEMEFVDVFRDSFASTEWRELMDLSSSSGVHEHNPLQEFSLRWAAKEAYTKALGVGLGFDFSSFQIHFEMDGSSPSLYRLLLETEPPGVSKYVSVQARVEWMENAAKDNKFIPDEIIVDYSRDHVWLFVFFPFYCGERKKAAFDTEKLGATKTDDSSIVGCACSCVGPFLRQQGNNGINVQRDDNGSFDDTAASLENLRVEVEWESLNSLVAFHSRNE